MHALQRHITAVCVRSHTRSQAGMQQKVLSEANQVVAKGNLDPGQMVVAVLDVGLHVCAA